MTVMLPIGKLKRLARQMLKGRYMKALAIVFISVIISRGPLFIVSFMFNSGVLSYILDLYTIIITGPITLGLTYYFLELFRNAGELGVGSFTNGFSNMWNAMGLFCTVLLRTILWSFLFVIPGIIAALRYSQAFYILAENPMMRPFECIARSTQMMVGNKGRLFLLELSYLPWYFILSIPAYVYLMETVDLSAVITTEQSILVVEQAMGQPAFTLLSLLPMLIRPLVATSEACFYDIASGSLQLQFDGQIPLDRDGSSHDVYEITGFENSEDRDE